MQLNLTHGAFKKFAKVPVRYVFMNRSERINDASFVAVNPDNEPHRQHKEPSGEFSIRYVTAHPANVFPS